MSKLVAPSPSYDHSDLPLIFYQSCDSTIKCDWNQIFKTGPFPFLHSNNIYLPIDSCNAFILINYAFECMWFVD